MAVGVGAADGEGVFFGEAETGGGFAGAGEGGGVGEMAGVGVEEVEEVGCSVWGWGWLVRGFFWFVEREGGCGGRGGWKVWVREKESEREQGGWERRKEFLLVWLNWIGCL